MKGGGGGARPVWSQRSGSVLGLGLDGSTKLRDSIPQSHHKHHHVADCRRSVAKGGLLGCSRAGLGVISCGGRNECDKKKGRLVPRQRRHSNATDGMLAWKFEGNEVSVSVSRASVTSKTLRSKHERDAFFFQSNTQRSLILFQCPNQANSSSRERN
jgi:hypothetical protein